MSGSLPDVPHLKNKASWFSLLCNDLCQQIWRDDSRRSPMQAATFIVHTKRKRSPYFGAQCCLESLLSLKPNPTVAFLCVWLASYWLGRDVRTKKRAKLGIVLSG